MLHEDRSRALSFGADAQRYDRVRPSYPAAMVDDLVGSTDAPEVLDVGCGTGISSRLFRDRGCRVLGLEPDPRMAEYARATGLDVEEGTIEGWDDGGRRFDLLTSGQAWHWVDPAQGAERAAGVLRQGGRVGLFWNVAVHDPLVLETFEAQYRALDIGIDEHSILLGRGSEDRFPLAAEGLRATQHFAGIEQREYHWAKRYTAETWLDQLPTHSDHATLPAEQLDKLVQRIDQAIAELGGAFDVGYRTVLVTASRT